MTMKLTVLGAIALLPGLAQLSGSQALRRK